MPSAFEENGWANFSPLIVSDVATYYLSVEATLRRWSIFCSMKMARAQNMTGAGERRRIMRQCTTMLHA